MSPRVCLIEEKENYHVTKLHVNEYPNKMSGKSDKLQSHKKKTEKKSGESRKYAQISYDSISCVAETNGLIALSEDIKNQLAEDVSYRLREVIHNCSIHLRQSRRRILSTADVNAVFQTSDVPSIYGHLNQEPFNLLYVKEAGVFVPDPHDVDLAALALSSVTLTQRGQPFVKGTWLPPDDTTDVSGNPQTAKADSTKPEISNSEKANHNPQIPSHLLSYYSHISKIILGNSESLVKVVLKDLKTNSKISPIAPYLLNLLALGLQKLPRGASYAHFRHRFLCTAEVLTCNSFIEPSATISVHRLISSLLLCLLDATLIEGTSARCNYELRNVVAQVLAKVVNCWCITDTKLHMDILHKLGSVLLDGSNSLRNHYAALRTVCAIGYAALDYCLWPHLEQYLTFLDIMRVQLEIGRNKMILSAASWIQQNADIMEIEGTILTATEMLYRNEWKSSQAQSPAEHNILLLEKLLEAYFGDTLCARRLHYPVATIKQEGAGTNTCNSGGMEVDMLVSAVMKDTGDSDFDYRNWTAIAKIPIHVPSLLVKSNRNLSAALPNRRFNMPSDLRISNTFELPVKHEHCPNTIHFNFAGANPMPKRSLKRRILDPRHAQLVCQSVYFNKSCQVSCIGKLVHRQHRITASKSWSADIMVLL